MPNLNPNIRPCTPYEIWRMGHVGPWFDYLCAHTLDEVSCHEQEVFFTAIVWC